MGGTSGRLADRRRFAQGIAAAFAVAASGPLDFRGDVLAQATPESPPVPSSKPLADVAATMDPAPVWEIFQDLTQVPRPSHHEEKVSAWVAEWARAHDLETSVDDVGNVFVLAPATSGMEDRPGVILQAHMDMVAVAAAGSAHDFLSEPIEAVVGDGWVSAVDTTLGADDGIGVSLILGLLTDATVQHGPLQAVFTVNEEDGFTGVNAIDPSALSGSILINVDSEEDWVFTIGSAGGMYVDASGAWTPAPAPNGMSGIVVTVGGGQGGHSGTEINAGRANANKLLARLLDDASRQFDLRLSTITGGDRYNAIPMQASALLAVPTDQSAPFTAFVNAFGAAIALEYAIDDPQVTASATYAPTPAGLMATEDQKHVLAMLHAVPNGVIRMSDALPGKVETSTNLGILSLGNGEWTAGFYLRSAVDSERDDVAATIEDIVNLAGARFATHGAYTGWAPNPNSDIVAVMTGVYKDLFASDPEISSIHAGLETSVFGAKNPELQMISVGPTLEGVHSPAERLEVASVPKEYALLAATLAAVGQA